MNETTPPCGSKARTLTLLGRDFTLPHSRRARIGIGAGLIFLGCLGFLPVLGFWMIPLGLLVLSYEIALMRRARRRLAIWWAYRNGRRRAGSDGNEDGL